MHIHLSEAMSKLDAVKEYPVSLGFHVFSSKLGDYPIVSCEPIVVAITCTDDKHLMIKTKVNLTMEIPCDRCLEPVNVLFDFDVEKEVDMNLTAEERAQGLDELSYIEDYDLDVDMLIRNELFVHMPVKVLCREDCKGICKKCGANLNNGTCGCDVTELDPRMAVIRDIFKNANQ
ncbi:MAG: DUF177 domain-containing protein [Lachnospiraceae bacterium]|nr:DUF177 domain-containing protein [Lachnospiraceae bacterium]